MIEKDIISNSKEKSVSKSIEDQFDDLFAPKKPNTVSDTKSKPAQPVKPEAKKVQQKILPQKPVIERETTTEATISKKEHPLPDTPPLKTTRQAFTPDKTIIEKRTPADNPPEKKDPVKQASLAVSEEIVTVQETSEPVVQNVFKKANQEYKKNITRDRIRQGVHSLIFFLLILLLVILSMFTGITMDPGIVIKVIDRKNPDMSIPGAKTVSVSDTIKKKEIVSKDTEEPVLVKAEEESKENNPDIQENDLNNIEIEKPSGTVSMLSIEKPDEQVDLIHNKKLSYPYSIYLGSYGSIETIKKASSDYRGMGISSYWVKLDLGKKGVWFRLFAGFFQTREDADEYIKARQLKNAESKLTKYTIFHGTYKSKDDADMQKAHLEELGYSPYILSDTDDAYRLYTGAFYQMGQAEDLQKDLEAKGIKSEIVER